MHVQTWRWKGVGLASVALVAAAGLTVGSAGAAQARRSGAHATGSTLTISFGNVSPYVAAFNPFSPTSELPAQGLVYEPLWFFDGADASQSHPWLATSYAWSNGGRTITFALRHGVKWTDGKAFTSADVAYTFNLIKSDPALNQSAIPITGAVAEGTDKVAINFSVPAYADIDYIAGTTYIVPQHIWKSISNPATFQDPKPVGTGPYEVSSVTGQLMSLTANPNYYVAGLPKFKTLHYLYFDSNTSADLAIEDGQVDWSGDYIPNIKKVYESKSPKYNVVNLPGAIVNLMPNMVSGPTANLAVRQALSDSINRKFISQSVYDGLVGLTNETDLVQPLFGDVTEPSLDKPFTYSDSAAKQVLEKAGYKLGANGYFAKGGKELTITAQVPSSFTDYVSDLDIVAQEARTAGINLIVQTESVSEYSSNRANGNFQLLIEFAGFTPSPYVYYKNLLDSTGVPAIGKIDAAGDYGRYDNPTVNSLLNAIAATPDTATQKPDFYKIEAIVAKDIPVIPLTNQEGDSEFNGSVVTGYPTLGNPYAENNGNAPDGGWLTPRLVPAK